MHILWIYNQPIIPEAGGTERMSSLIAKGLCSQGHICLGVLVFNEQTGIITHEGNEIAAPYEFLRKNNVDLVINQIAYQKWLLSAFMECGGQRWVSEGGNIISCLHFDPKNPSLLYLLKSKRDKTITDYVHIAKAYVLQKYYEGQQRAKERNTYNFIYDNSQWFVVLSNTHIPYMEKVMKRCNLDRLVAINNPLTFDETYNPNELCKKKNIILVCARMSEYHKRISIILKTWASVQKKCEMSHDWVLKIVGNGPDLQFYKDWVAKQQIHNISFENQQSPEPYYREAKILLITSSAEGWGLAITEGLQNGVVPIVMNSSSVFSEIIQSGCNGYLTPNNNIKAFAQQLEALISDPNLLEELQLNAIKSASNFSLDNTMKKWAKIIQK